MQSAKSDQKEAQAAWELVGGHPYYLIMLAENRKPNENIKQTYQRILTSSSGAPNLYINYLLKEDLGSSTKEARLTRILQAISQGKTTPSQIATHIKLKLLSLPYYLQELEKYDLIKKTKKIPNQRQSYQRLLPNTTNIETTIYRNPYTHPNPLNTKPQTHNPTDSEKRVTHPTTQRPTEAQKNPQNNTE